MQNKSLVLKKLPQEGFWEVVFDLQGESVNKLGAVTLSELRTAVTELQKENPKGVLFRSNKEAFIAGADVTEFLGHFNKPVNEIKTWLLWVDKIFSDIEDLPCPTVCAINGFALGGGFELALACSARVMSLKAKVGLPETKLGIFPGWGGTVRLSRLCGVDTAVEWIASGNQWKSDVAFKAGAVDAVIDDTKDPNLLHTKATELLYQLAKTDFQASAIDWQKRQSQKKNPITLSKVESQMAFGTSMAFVSAQAGKNYPAPVKAIEVMQKGATLTRDAALEIEAEAFAEISKTQTAECLVSVFLSDQLVKKKAKAFTKKSEPVKSAAVLGAGIMGGGVAYQSASSGVPIIMKDITPKALELGMGEAIKLLNKQVERKKITPAKMATTVASISPQLQYNDWSHLDIVVEAVVENEKIKKSVLAEVEEKLSKNSILTSNTSTISISRLAEGLKRPENFCGMHFFNPVHKMPLVEIIRGKKSSEASIAKTVAYASAMGKTPIVVNDCPGFLVNRVLFPYFAGFMQLVDAGVDFIKIDQVMEKFGWPMGPAYLLDVVGIDTACHADSVMASEFPDRMSHKSKTAIEKLYEAKRLGQKNGLGFYTYAPDKKGAPKKSIDPSVLSILGEPSNHSMTDEEIVYRLMLPMIFESARCLEENIVESPEEVDIALIYGLGFPPFRGGLMKYADSIGAEQLRKIGADYSNRFGKLYSVPNFILNLQTSFYKKQA